MEAEKLLDVDRKDALLDIYFSQDEVFNRITKLHCNKVLGVDGLVSNIFIETTTDISLPFLSYLEVN